MLITRSPLNSYVYVIRYRRSGRDCRSHEWQSLLQVLATWIAAISAADTFQSSKRITFQHLKKLFRSRS
jgi:hypothetical protein